MDPRNAAGRIPDQDAVEFIRFCYRRRRVGWPELYDEMCAVAARGLYRGLCADDLAVHGIGFGLFDMPALAVASAQVVAEEQARRRPVAVVIAPEATPSHDVVLPARVAAEAVASAAMEPAKSRAGPALPRVVDQPEERTTLGTPASSIRFSPVPAGA
jgi:hypothetical protein